MATNDAGTLEVTVAFLAWLESSRPGLAAHAELLLGETLPVEVNPGLTRILLEFPGRAAGHPGYDRQVWLPDRAAVACDLVWLRPRFTALAGPTFLWRTEGSDSDVFLVSPNR